MVKSILVAVDGSANATAALDLAADIAAKLGARLLVVNVVTAIGLDRVPEGLRSYVELEHVRVTERDLLQGASDAILAHAAERARERGVGDVEILSASGDPAHAIVATARQRGVDLVVMGRRGLGTVKELLLGSVSHKVCQLAECACLTVPPSG